MGAFDFMKASFAVLVGAVCVALAALVLYAVIAGIIKSFKGQNRAEDEKHKFHQ